MNAISVDWDFFFHNPGYDWGHRESSLYENPMLWQTRVIGMLRARLGAIHCGVELIPCWHDEILKTYIPTGQEIFWTCLKKHFSFDQAELFVSNSHVHTYNVLRDSNHIYSFDAHGDLGYQRFNRKSKKVYCDDWLRYLVFRAKTHASIIYPDEHTYDRDWRPHWNKLKVQKYLFNDWIKERHEIIKIDRVFICQSRAWTPPWADEDFVEFVNSTPRLKRTDIENLEPRKWTLGGKEAMDLAKKEFMEMETIRRKLNKSNDVG